MSQTETDKLREENTRLREENDEWRHNYITARMDCMRFKKEIERLRSRAIQDGQAVLVYTDEGPKGPCAQSMNAMAPRASVHVFPDLDTLKAFAEKHLQTIRDRCKRPVIRHFVIGEEGGDTLIVHGEQKDVTQFS